MKVDDNVIWSVIKCEDPITVQKCLPNGLNSTYSYSIAKPDLIGSKRVPTSKILGTFHMEV